MSSICIQSISRAACALVLIVTAAQDESQSHTWKPGPCLFLDDNLVAESKGLTRRIRSPVRLTDPIITGAREDGTGDNCFQPYVTVVKDPETLRFRMWYGVPENTGQSHVAYIDSEDGIHWNRPHRVLKDPDFIQFGVSMIDLGRSYSNLAERFKFGFYGRKEGQGGLRIAVSPDGLEWRITDGFLSSSHDITWIGWDPIRSRYIAFVSMVQQGETWSDPRRIPHMSISTDCQNWKAPWRVVKPEDGEGGETQFYCMSGAIARGETLVALVKVLRDDLNAEPGMSALEMGDDSRKAAGLGYTVLAWSYDGETWARDVEPFLDRNPLPGSWDRAMSWGDCQLAVEDEIFIYYGGYQRGHKVNRFAERQIGLAHMMRDRYVARAAGAEEGLLRTKPRVLQAGGLTINSRGYGALEVRLLDEAGKPIGGFDWGDMDPIVGDAVSHQVRWKNSLAPLRGKEVALEFALSNAELFAFDWTD